METDFNILVVSRLVKFYNSIIPLIEKCEGGKTFFAASISDARRILMTQNISAIILNTPLTDGFGLDFAIKCASENNYAVLMLTSQEFFEQVSEKATPVGILTLQKPTSAEIISQTLLLLKSTVLKISSLKDKEADESDKVKELNILNHAKMLLIGALGMSEEQAHKYIGRRAMETGKTKLYIAKSIIKSYRN
ncbi:MAG: ANTAR domain-containing protein [Clostridia bacterium]|nr:ANTAR domain-containing protein [Clostridia bacterium]